ncbi:MAG: RpiB/LacA/LacB family sugar-phosphate isomerase [Spirochaetales bacterium]|jgi:ribose 5-phosphate isomerase RpiB|nr:RpiB/LacA/LacB family sugar-phosphate isomerase [Spirochaetales bacterium]
MKIAVIIEGSTKHRSSDVVKALDGLGHEVHNLGMKNVEGEPDLTYLETGFLTALLLNLKAVDFVVGGCGTGQGYINTVLQFPGTACGLLLDVVDVYLFSQVNAGNCISLPLNKGYGLGGDLNLRFLFTQLFKEPFGGGYPPARKEIQIGARKRLVQLSQDTHKPIKEIIAAMDKTIIQRALGFPGVLDFIKAAPASELKDCVLSVK